MVRKLIKICVLSLLCGFVMAEGPAWWTERGVLTSDPADDTAPVVLGQLKLIANEAYNELMEKVPLDESHPVRTALENQLNTWLPDGVENAVANIGQVKQIGTLVYDWLIEVGYTDSYPWPDGSNQDPEDFAVALIGQVKYIFNFEIIGVDTDGDGIPDWWEIRNGMNPGLHDSYLDLLGTGWPMIYVYKSNFGRNAILVSLSGDWWCVCGQDPCTCQDNPVYTDIASAVLAAGVGDTIIIDDGIYSGVNNKNIKLDKPLMIKSRTDADHCIIELDSNVHPAGEDPVVGRAFAINNGTDMLTAISGITIQNGSLPSGDSWGAGIAGISSRINIYDCMFKTNVAYGPYNTGYGGGAAFVEGCIVSIESCLFEGHNTGRDGAGGCVSASKGTKLGLTSCIFDNNYSPVCVYNNYTHGELSVLGMDSCIFRNSYSKLYGGTVVASDAHNTSIINCQFLDNKTSTVLSSQTWNPTGSFLMSGCLFSRNTQQYSSSPGMIRIVGATEYDEYDVPIQRSQVKIQNCQICDNLMQDAVLWLYGHDTETVMENTAIYNNHCSAIRNSGNLIMKYCTITHNGSFSSGFPGGIAMEAHINHVLVTANVERCVIAYNIPEDQQIGFYNPGDWREDTAWTHAQDSLIFGSVQGDHVNLVGCPNADPYVAKYGFRLMHNSPCITSELTTPIEPGEDIDGEARGYPPWLDIYDIGSDEFIDTDGDIMGDAWEMMHFSSMGALPSADPDRDGLTNLEEYNNNTDPNNFDTDGDLFPDGWEVVNGFNPRWPWDPSKTGDSDEDGLNNFDEYRFGTDSHNTDTDGDGVQDGTEVANGSNPDDADDEGLAINCVSIKLTVGDDSGSHSERYALIVGENTITHVGEKWGELAYQTYNFVKGKTYPFRVKWIDTKYGEETDREDYTARIGWLEGTGQGDGYSVQDSEGILGVHLDDPVGYVDNKEGLLIIDLIKVDLDVDSNNNNGFGYPDRSDDEDQIEDEFQDNNKCLKVIRVNSGDVDQDGIVDWADGYNRDGVIGNQDDGLAGVSFVPIVLELPEPLDISTARIKLTYEDSSPSGVTVSAGGGLVLDDGYLRIWKKNATDVRNKSSIASGGDYIPAGTYSAGDLGFSTGTRKLTFYMEAVQRSWTWQSRRILVEVDPNDESTEPGFSGSDAVRISAIRIRFRQEIDDSAWLWDWGQVKDDAGNITAIHSPAYIFGKEDNIVVQIDGAPQLLGNSYFKINVGSSASDPVGINLDLHEDASRPGYYWNTSAAPSCMLRLGADTAVGTGFITLKVVEEEDLIGKLKKADGAELGCEGRVMVDRGEFATGTGNDPNINTYRVAAANAFEDGMENRDNLKWWDVGRVRSADISAFIRDAGSANGNDGEADILWFQCHGDYDQPQNLDDANGDLITVCNVAGVSDVIFSPDTIAAGNWSKDVEWVVLRTCGSLCEYATPVPLARNRWASRLVGRDHPAHGLLGYCEPTTSELQGGWFNNGVTYFLDALVGEYTMPTAWIYANTHLSVNEPYAVVCLEENRNDRIRGVIYRDVRVSNVNDDDFCYWWYHANSDGATHSEGTSDQVNSGHTVLSEQLTESVKKIGMKLSCKTAQEALLRTPYQIDIEAIALAKEVTLKKMALNLLVTGDQKSFFKELQADNVLPVHKDKAVTVADDFLKTVVPEWPIDAKLMTVAPMFFAKGTNAPVVMGYVVEYGHTFYGCNIVGDFVKVTVTAGGVVGYSERWHMMKKSHPSRKRAHPKGLETPVMSVERAIENGSKRILRCGTANQLKKREITLVRPVFFCDVPAPTQAILGYELEMNRRFRFVFDAETGDPLRRKSFKDTRKP